MSKKSKSAVEQSTSGGWYTIKEDKRTVTYSFWAKGIVYTGRSFCSLEDKFDPERGKLIAKLRAILCLKKDSLREIETDLAVVMSVLTPATLKIVEGPIREKIDAYKFSILNLEKKIAAAVK